jgi:hypothetical protein
MVSPSYLSSILGILPSVNTFSSVISVMGSKLVIKSILFVRLDELSDRLRPYYRFLIRFYCSAIIYLHSSIED